MEEALPPRRSDSQGVIGDCAMEVIPSTITSQLGPLGLLEAKFSSFISNNRNRLPEGVIGDIKGLIEPLQEISSYAMELLKAENHSLRAKSWTKQVRELSFHIADYLDMAMHTSAGVDVSSAAQISKDISRFSARLEEVNQRGKRFKSNGAIRPKPMVSNVPELQNPPDAGRFDETVNKIAEFLDRNTQNQNNVVSIVGFPGAGKTTVARKFYHKFGRGFDCRAFLRVSRNLDTRMLLISMLSQIKGGKPPGSSEVHDLLHHIKEHLKNRTYLVVIDELWDASAWDIIRRAFPEANSDSSRSIIITATQTEDVALACCGYNEKYIFNMEPQNDDEQRKLFPGCHHQLLEEVLASESNFLMERWHTQHSLSSTLGTSPTCEVMKEVRNLIYNDLPPHLKTCLLYLYMYPEDCVIKKDDLVKQWVAESFVNIQENQDAEQVAETYYDELVSKRMIQPENTYNNNDVLSYSCTVHHMVMDLISCKSMEENFITSLDCFQSCHEIPDKIRRLSVKFGVSKEAQIPRSIRMQQIRSLIIFGFLDCVPSVHEYILLRVLVLHIWADQDDRSLNLAKIGELSLLTYLNINYNMSVILPAKIQVLEFLETLEVDARECTVPSDIINLPRLLHLRLPRNIDLPHDIGHMTSLRSLVHFNLDNSSRDNVLQLGELTNLRDLHLTCSSLNSENLKERIEDLGIILPKHSNLKSLILAPDCFDESEPEASITSGMTTSCDGLSSLSSPPALLQRLEIMLPWTCTFSMLPQWIGNLRELCILKIEVEKLTSDGTDILKGLPALTALSLYVRSVPEKSIVVKEGFTVLKYFKFLCAAPRLQFNKGAMLKVQSLRLGFSAKRMEHHKLLVAGFENLTGLEEVSAKISNYDSKESDRSAVKDALVDAFKNNPMKPVVNVRCVDVGWLSYVDKQKSIAPQDQIEKHDVIADDGTDEYYGTEEKSLWKGDSSKRMAGYPEPFVKDAPSAMRGASSNKGVTVSSPVDSSHMQNPGLDKAGNKAAIVIKHAMVSVSTGAMNSLLMKLETLMGEQYSELTGTAEQGLILKDELQTMNSLLKQLPNMSDPTLKECRNHIRELTYDIEDSVDDLMANKKGSGSQKRVMLHEFIGQIQKLKALVEKADIQSMACETEMLPLGRSYAELCKVYDQSNGLVGMDGPLDELVMALIGSAQDKLQAVCIVGDAGIGKTTLAIQVYNEIKRRFHSCVFISAPKKVDSYDNEDRMARLCTGILSQLRGTNYVQDIRRDNLIYEVKRHLKATRFVIVVDGVWCAEILEDMKFALPENDLGSRIITTSRISNIAVSCGKHFSSFEYRMKPLAFEESLSLFRCIISGSGRSCPIAPEKDHKQIVEACRDIPLAVMVIAGALSSKPAEIERRWSAFEKRMEEMDHQNVEWIQKILNIGYSDLSCDMKTCLLYLSAFPENQVIRKDRLIRRWEAEGFLTETSEETWWETGVRYFLELIARKLIEPVYDEEDVLPIGCKVSGSIHDFITSLSSQENFVTPDVTNQTSMQHGVFRRLSVDLGSNNKEKQLALSQLGASSSKVRSLTLLGGYDYDFVRMLDLSAFKHVRVLDLEDTKGLENEQLKSIGGLSLLRFLGLGGTDVTNLPPQIMALKQLTTLDLRRTRVRKLPELRDTKLVSVLADELVIRRGMEGMQSLEDLSKVLVGPDGSLADDVVGLVKKLRQLRRLGVRVGRLNDRNETDRQGVKRLLEEVGKSNLQSFLLDNYPHGLLDLLVDSWAPEGPHYLRKFELRICDCLTLVPQAMHSLMGLTHLHISFSVVAQEGVRALGSLPNLMLLKLHLDTSPRLILSSDDGFPCLKVFWYDCRQSDGIQFEAGAMPQLRRLGLDFNVRDTMSKYGDLISGIQHLSCLVEVRVTASEVEDAEAHIRAQVSANPNKPVLELNTRCQGQFSIHEAADESVITINSMDEWMSQIDPNKLVVIHFTAQSCIPSLVIAPVFADLAKKNKFQNVIFLKVDIDEMDEDIAQNFGVDGTPIFLFMVEGAIVDRVDGAKKEELVEKLDMQVALRSSVGL